MRAFIESIRSNKLRVAVTLDYAPKKMVEAFDLYCQAVWAFLDGRADTVILVEEMAAVQPSIGKAGDSWGRIVRESRKYGGIILGTTQRSQEIDKTLFTQIDTKYVGFHAPRDAKSIALEIDVDPAAVSSLETLQFYVKDSPRNPARLVDFRPNKPTAKKKAPQKKR